LKKWITVILILALALLTFGCGAEKSDGTLPLNEAEVQLVIDGTEHAEAGRPISTPDDSQTPITQLKVITIDTSMLGLPLIAVGGFIYYSDDNGMVYKAPIEAPEKSTLVYRMERNTDYLSIYDFLGKYACFEPDFYGDIPILSQRLGTSTRGSSYSTLLLPDGTTRTYDFQVTAYESDGRNSAAIGYNAAYYGAIGWKGFLEINNKDIELDAGSLTVFPASSLAINDDHVYITASRWTGTDSFPGIYRVDVRTEQAERVIDEQIYQFKVSGAFMYFLGADRYLYKLRFGSNKQERVSDIKMQEFFLVGNEIFYTATEQFTTTAGLFKLSNGEKLNLDLELDQYEFGYYSKIVDGYLVTRIYNHEAEGWQGIVIDQAGNVYKSGPGRAIEFITIHNGTIWEFV